jgi:hypothetical protein
MSNSLQFAETLFTSPSNSSVPHGCWADYAYYSSSELQQANSCQSPYNASIFGVVRSVMANIATMVVPFEFVLPQHTANATNI